MGCGDGGTGYNGAGLVGDGDVAAVSLGESGGGGDDSAEGEGFLGIEKE